MTDQRKPRIIIVGGGLGGLSLALGIAKIGKYHVTVVEKRQHFIRQGSAFGLAPNGIKALRELGLESIVEEMRETGIEYCGVEYPVKPIMMLWWVLRDALLARVLAEVDKEESTMSLCQGVELSEIRDDPSARTVKLLFGNSDLVLEGELVVGADGVHSQVRDLLQLPPADFNGKMSYRGHIDVNPATDMPQNDRDKLIGMLEKGIVPLTVLANDCSMQVFSFHPKMSRLAWVLNVPMDMFAEIDSTQDAFDKAFQGNLRNTEESDEKWESIQLVKKYNNPDHTWCSAMRTHDLSNEGLAKLEASMGHQKQIIGEGPNRHGWGGRGRVTLIGDAAHSMRAVSGQGGSMAMEDAVLLCRILGRDDVVTILGMVYNGTNEDTNHCHLSCEEHVVKAFEEERFSRVQLIHQDQETRARAVYRSNKLTEPWSTDFESMVYGGI